MDEQDAIDCLKRGDLAGLEWLVRCYQVQVVHTAYLILGDRLLAEDVAQSTFIKAAERIHQFDETRPFRPWFMRSVVNAALKAARHQKRLVALDAYSDEQVHELLDSFQDDDPNPEEQFDSEEMRQAVWSALSNLRPDHRAAIILKYFLGLNDKESAERLGRPLTTIKWWLHVARNRLRDLLFTWNDEV